MGATISLCQGSNCNFGGIFKGCRTSSSLPDDLVSEISERESRFDIVKKIPSVPHDIMDDPDDIVITLVVNNEQQILSMIKNSMGTDSREFKIANQHLDDLDDLLPRDVAATICKLYSSCKEEGSKNVLIRYHNYDYQLCGIPVLNDERQVCVLIIQKLFFRGLDII